MSHITALVNFVIVAGVCLVACSPMKDRSPVTRSTQQQSKAVSSTGAQTQAPGDPATRIQPPDDPATQSARGVQTPSAERTNDFIRAVLGDTEDVWDQLFLATRQRAYPKPIVVLVSRWALSGCGKVGVSSGLFYCDVDSRIYLDPAFLSGVSSRFGDFVAAYLIAREVGRHVQNVLDTKQMLETAVTTLRPEQLAEAQTRLEMQADCYAGVWAYFVKRRGLIEPRELEVGPAAALTVGDAATHSEHAVQRLRSFQQGLATGDPRSCDVPSLPAAAWR